MDIEPPKCTGCGHALKEHALSVGYTFEFHFNETT